MRRDMQDVIVNTGRHGGYDREFLSRRFRLKNAPDDSLPKRISNSRRKYLGDRTRPLYRFLASNCGRKWSEVYKEICACADARSIRGYHLRSHVLRYVQSTPFPARPYYTPEFFVDAQGFLQRTKRESYRFRKGEHVWSRMRKELPPYLHWPYVLEQCMRCSAHRAVYYVGFKVKGEIDLMHFEPLSCYVREKGFWYAYSVQEIVHRNRTYEDLALVDGEVQIVRRAMPDYVEHAVGKRQVPAKLQKQLDLNWRQPCQG